MFSKMKMIGSIEDYSDKIEALKSCIEEADAVFIGAGAGLSTSAGNVYTGERFMKYCSDFYEKYGITDFYSGSFYPFETREEYWGWYCRLIWVNRFKDVPLPVYEMVLDLVKDKNYHVITTNVDHCFQKAGFDKERLFYTQGDYGLAQCPDPCHQETYDTYDLIRQMVESQGFIIGEDNDLILPEGVIPKMTVPTELVPVCPVCGKQMKMNLRGDNTFVQNEGWYAAHERYENFRKANMDGQALFLDLGTGFNTPVWFKYPFWQMTYRNENAVYACLNFGEAVAPDEILPQSILINEDIYKVLCDLKAL